MLKYHWMKKKLACSGTIKLRQSHFSVTNAFKCQLKQNPLLFSACGNKVGFILLI